MNLCWLYLSYLPYIRYSGVLFLFKQIIVLVITVNDVGV